MVTTSAQLLARLSSPTDLLPAIVQDRRSREVLMLAWMNHKALEITLRTRQATFWSRSRNEIWVKGETSGNTQHIHEIRFDCDADALLLIVDTEGPACHTGEESCFHNLLNKESIS